MAQIEFHGRSYHSVSELPIPRAQTNRALDGFTKQPKPLYPSIVKTKFGSEYFISYRGTNLPPSPETIHLAQNTAEIIANHYTQVCPTVVDLGTGSGVIAVTIAAELNRRSIQSNIVATDISGAALEVAELNANLNNVDISFRRRDMFSGLRTEFGPLDVVIFNPPFYYSNRFPEKFYRAGFIPRIAMDGGKDSLDFYRRLFSEGTQVISDRGVIITQIQDYKLREISAIAMSEMGRASIASLPGLRGLVGGLIVGNPNVVEAIKNSQTQPLRARAPIIAAE